MTAINTYFSRTTLKVNSLNYSMNEYTYLFWRTNILIIKNRHQLREKEWRVITKQHAGMGILIPAKIDLKLNLFRRDKEGHFFLIKERINQNSITIQTQMHNTQVHSIPWNMSFR